MNRTPSSRPEGRTSRAALAAPSRPDPAPGAPARAALRRAGLRPLAAAVAALALAGAPPAHARQSDAPTAVVEAYARAKAGAVVRNFEDSAGNELMRLEAGHPLRVYGTSQGVPRFHQVEVAGGVPVWVFGELLQPTNQDGMLRVAANQVNMRPLPESSPRSMALRAKLSQGDKVVLIERQDPSKPLAQDWVKVWAPESARVWIDVSQVDLVPAGDAAALSAARTAWVERQHKPVAAARAAAAPAKAGAGEERPRALTVPITTVPPEALRLLTEADLAFDAALAAPEASSTTWADVEALYRQTIDLAPEGTATRARAEERVLTAGARRGVAELREQMLQEDERRRRELATIMAERERQELRNTVHMGRFEARGWLSSRVVGGERRWYLEWSGETVAEVRCTSERYDLAVFEGHELGLKATTISPPVAATTMTEALPRVLDILRIEVLSASQRRR